MKKVISILLALGLVLGMTVIATPALADTAVTNLTVALDPAANATECETACYNITFNCTLGLSPGQWIRVKFPVSTGLSGAVATVNTVSATVQAVTTGEIDILVPATVHISAGAGVKLTVCNISNASAGTYNIGVRTVWDQELVEAPFTINPGGTLDPTSVVWCPCHNITVDVDWGGSTNITAVDGATWGTDFVVDTVNDKLTIACTYLTGLGLNTCGVKTLNIDFDPGCNKTLTLSVADAANVSLIAGWNLISLPIEPLSTAIEDVLADVLANVKCVWYYDGCEDAWYAYKNGADADFGLETMEAGKAYWIDMAAAGTMKLCGYELPCPPGGPPCYCYCHCWNMVGFKSTNTSMTRGQYLANLNPSGSLFGALTWTQATGWQTVNNGTQMIVGRGYWMAFMTDACFAPPV